MLELILILFIILIYALITVGPFLFLVYIFGDNKILNKIAEKIF